MSSAGLRNWRGEIIPLKVDPPEGQELLTMTDKDDPQSYDDKHNVLVQEPTTKEPCSETIRVLRKDEFGRDVVEEIRSKKESKKQHKHKHKRKKHHEDIENRSRSQSPRGALAGTLPPPDPYRPQLDEDRGKRLQRTHRSSRSRSRSRSRSKRNRSRHQSRSRSWDTKAIRLGSRRRHVRRSSSRTRSRSRGRNYSRSPSLRSYRKRSSVSVERRWTHSAFDNRSPSPPRQVNPLYRPEPEAWASRAGGVYLPRK